MTESNITTPQRVCASLTGALITSLVMTPLDVVKVRLQAQAQAASSGSNPSSRRTFYRIFNGLADGVRSADSCARWYKACGCSQKSVRFTGTVDAFLKISKYEGISALWNGLPPTLAMAVPSTVIYFVAYEKFRDAILSMFSVTPAAAGLVSGPFARLIASACVSPLEKVRTQMQAVAQPGGIGKVTHFIELFRGNWGPSMWRGLGATLLRDVPFSAVYWFMYETLKNRCLSNGAEYHFHQAFLSGLVAGSAATVATHPFDIVKTRVQIEMINPSASVTTSSCAYCSGPFSSPTPHGCAVGSLYWSPLQCPAVQRFTLVYKHSGPVMQRCRYGAARHAAGFGGAAHSNTGQTPSLSTMKMLQQIYVTEGWRGLTAGFVPRLIRVAPSCAIMIMTYEAVKSYARRLPSPSD